MNDGIYYPFDPARFEKYQQGMRRLIEHVRATGASLTLLTPSVFDAQPVRAVAKPAGEAKYSWMAPFAGYDSVLERYSQWLVTLREPTLPVLDLHSTMRTYFDAVRRDDPQYQLCGDGVHFGPSGHWLVAEQILAAWHSPAEVGGFTLDLEKARALGGKIDQRDPQTVHWISRLPMPMDPRWDSHLVATEQIADRWNRYRLAAVGLSQPRYEIFEGDQLLGTVAREELVAGVDLTKFAKLSTVRRSQQLLPLVIQRQESLSLAWLNDVGFKRPGTPAGLPLEEAKKKAAELEAKIRKLAQPTEIVLTIRPAR